ncbi:unnamed protein product [Medioppia subpectinata]|uniref:Uncharacterized protein n=1 Tax=Medioppia subpectinata TaxID=1979941 RepID=A0A7R9KVY4_9ACAR|nr:unnamed protein product [Medioppia subpectinata]CAG2110866.1 unnamed protein product [Medioppia subpectinata]
MDGKFHCLMAIHVPMNGSGNFNISNNFIKTELLAKYVYNKLVDVGLDIISWHHMMPTFAHLMLYRINPSIAVLCGYYPNTQSNQFDALFHIFDKWFWIFLVITTVRVKYWSHRYVLIISLLFLAKFLILNICNQMILSITIKNPYEVIDTLAELDARPQLRPIVSLSIAKYQDLMSMGTRIEKKILTRNRNERDNLIGSKNMLYYNQIARIVADIRERRTHVLIGTGGAISILEKAINTGPKSVHMMADKGYYRCNGWIVRNTKTLTESGLLDYWMYSRTGIMFNKLLMKQPVDTIATDASKTNLMKLDAIKIALGPYIITTPFAILGLVMEFMNV